MGSVEIYTDGCAVGNPGKGGYGIVVRSAGEAREFSGGFQYTTNNRMEIFAAVEALRITRGAKRTRIYSDSALLVNAMTLGWIRKWKRSSWLNSGKAPVKNRDLWEALDRETDGREVEFVKVKGHSGVPDNHRCDKLAKIAAKVPINDLDIDAVYASGEAG